MSRFPKDSIEFKVQTVLNDLIRKVGEDLYTDDFKRSESFNTPETRLDTLGIIISKFCEWDGENIKAVALSAFEDSNFRNVEIDLGN